MLVEAHGYAAAGDAWSDFITPATWSAWAPHIRHVETADTQLRPGTTGTIHGALGVAVEFLVTEVDSACNSWTWEVGHGPLRATMDHHIVPSARGGCRAFMRVRNPTAAALAQPYRPLARRALRNLMRAPKNDAPRTNDVRVFPFAFAPAYRAPARAAGITPRTAWVELSPSWLYVRYGPWRLLTSRRNIAAATITGDFHWVKTAGPPRLSLSDRRVSMTSNGDQALCLRFHTPVAAIDPAGAIAHPGAMLAVADPRALKAALGL